MIHFYNLGLATFNDSLDWLSIACFVGQFRTKLVIVFSISSIIGCSGY